GLDVELDAGREAPGQRPQRGERARELGAEEEAGLDVDEIVRAPRAEAEHAAGADRELGPVAVAVRRAAGDHGRQRRAPPRPLPPTARPTSAFFAWCCASRLTCCHWQPPHNPKIGHGGAIRSSPGRSIAASSAQATFPFSRSRRARTRSPGAASGTKVTRPSA